MCLVLGELCQHYRIFSISRKKRRRWWRRGRRGRKKDEVEKEVDQVVGGRRRNYLQSPHGEVQLQRNISSPG